MRALDRRGILDKLEKLVIFLFSSFFQGFLLNLNSRMVLSPHFTFLVGQDRTPITIHADVVKDLSAPLHAMINNGVMIESATKVAVLEDVEVEVFQKFCQFAYTGDYTVDEIDPDKEDEVEDLADSTAQDTSDTKKASTPVDESQDKTSNATSTLISRQIKTTTTRKTNTSPEFQRLRTRIRGQFQKLRRYHSPGHQINYVAKIHVDIFIFADKYLIESLRRRSLDYLHYEIENIKPCPTPKKIVRMLGYILDHTTPYETARMFEISDLIYRYASCHVRDLASEPAFQGLIQKRPHVAANLFKALTM